jgi:dinuclear metal center YbgI/SA1388 family protein
MKISDLTGAIERIAPPMYQEDYDNAGLLVGDPSAEATGVLISLDTTEAVLDEAIAKGCNLVLSHHPIVFRGLKRLNGKNHVERTVMKAVRHGVAIYAAHTNADNMLYNGVNTMIAEKLGVRGTRILSPKTGILKKLVTYAPHEHAARVLEGLFAAGAGHIGRYDECSFSLPGTGTFRAGPGTDPFVGQHGIRQNEPETMIEVIFSAHQQSAILKALRAVHPYEEIAYSVISIENPHPDIGAGMVGELEAPMPTADFLLHVKNRMGAGCLRHTRILKPTVQRIAFCGGAGSFLLGDAIGSGADVYISADFKYHEFFGAEDRIVIADIGHFECEQYTMELFFRVLSEKFPTFAVRLAETSTNPVHYL